jgi:hypothetical protein
MKPLKLQRTTVRNLSNDEMSGAAGGTIIIRRSVIIACVPVTIVRSIACPSAVDGCPSTPGGCDTTTVISDTGTSVINPGGGGF